MATATYKISEARAQFSELLKRAQAGEEILITHGNDPVARIVPAETRKPRRPGILRELLGDMTDQQISDLAASVTAPLSDRDQRILEGEGTDDVGVWIGLPEDRKSNP